MAMQYLYRHYDKEGSLLYVGISLSAINRLSQHKVHAHWFEKITQVTIEKFESRKEAIEAEKKAIINENPIHNLYRPLKKDQSNYEKHGEMSKQQLTSRIVHFNPLYSLSDAAQTLNISSSKIKELIESKILGAILIREKWDDRWQKMQKIYKITGWQLIDFLENLESGVITMEGMVESS